jgi:hypothetical protein
VPPAHRLSIRLGPSTSRRRVAPLATRPPLLPHPASALKCRRRPPRQIFSPRLFPPRSGPRVTPLVPPFTSRSPSATEMGRPVGIAEEHRRRLVLTVSSDRAPLLPLGSPASSSPLPPRAVEPPGGRHRPPEFHRSRSTAVLSPPSRLPADKPPR